MVRSSWKLLVLCLGLSACAFNIQQVKPRPNIAATLPQGVQLTLAPSIENDYKVPQKNGILGADVHEWRTSLTNGFKAAFESADKAGGMTLDIQRADLSFAAAAVNGGAMAVAAEAQITYKAVLKDSSGAVVKTSAQTVSSKAAFMQRYQVADAVTSAVESMYEAIAKDLF